MAGAAALTAAGAWAGAVGLAVGAVDLGTKLDSRLPFASPVFGGTALAVVVGLPFTVVAGLAWRADRRAGLAAEAAGVALIAWILVELAFIRAVSLLQLFFAVVGVLFVWVGRQDGRAQVIEGACPMMFLEPVRGFHGIHRRARRA